MKGQEAKQGHGLNVVVFCFLFVSTIFNGEFI